MKMSLAMTSSAFWLLALDVDVADVVAARPASAPCATAREDGLARLGDAEDELVELARRVRVAGGAPR